MPCACPWKIAKNPTTSPAMTSGGRSSNMTAAPAGSPTPDAVFRPRERYPQQAERTPERHHKREGHGQHPDCGRAELSAPEPPTGYLTQGVARRPITLHGPLAELEFPAGARHERRTAREKRSERVPLLT